MKLFINIFVATVDLRCKITQTDQVRKNDHCSNIILIDQRTNKSVKWDLVRWYFISQVVKSASRTGYPKVSKSPATIPCLAFKNHKFRPDVHALFVGVLFDPDQTPTA